MKFPDKYAARGDEQFYARSLKLALRISSTADLVYKVIMSLFAAAFAFACVSLLFERMDRDPPSEIVGVRLLTPQTSPGDKLRVAFSLVRKRICQIDVQSSTFDGAGNLHVGPTEHRDASGPIGPDFFVRHFDVPEDSVPGRGRLRLTWSWQCPGNYMQAIDPITKMMQFDFVITPKPP